MNFLVASQMHVILSIGSRM